MTGITLGNIPPIPTEKIFHVSLVDHASRVTQRDYLNAIMQVRVERDVRIALNSVQVQGEHHLDEWTVTGKGVYVGSWSKRLAKYIYKEHHIKIDPQVISIITERVTRTMEMPAEKLSFKFSKTDWSAGEFGEKTDSCWWGGYSYCRHGILSDPNGGAIKFMDENQDNRARCWYYNIENSLLIFNAYDKNKQLDILKIARLISLTFGMDYRKHTEVSIDRAYVNGKSIYAIGNPPIERPIALDFALRRNRELPSMMSVTSLVYNIDNNTDCPNCHRDSPLVEVVGGRTACTSCTMPCGECGRRTIYNSDAIRGDGSIVCPECRVYYHVCDNCDRLVRDGEDCENCSNESFFCASCEEDCTGESYTTRNGDTVCESCRDDYYSYCQHCDELCHNDDGRWLDNYEYWVCDSCLADKYVSCVNCEHDTLVDDATNVGDNYYCDSCRAALLSTCDRCHGDCIIEGMEQVYIEEDQEASEEWCESCIDTYASYCAECGETYALYVNHGHTPEEHEELP